MFVSPWDTVSGTDSAPSAVAAFVLICLVSIYGVLTRSQAWPGLQAGGCTNEHSVTSSQSSVLHSFINSFIHFAFTIPLVNLLAVASFQEGQHVGDYFPLRESGQASLSSGRDEDCCGHPMSPAPSTVPGMWQCVTNSPLVVCVHRCGDELPIA